MKVKLPLGELISKPHQFISPHEFQEKLRLFSSGEIPCGSCGNTSSVKTSPNIGVVKYEQSEYLPPNLGLRKKILWHFLWRDWLNWWVRLYNLLFTEYYKRGMK